MKRIKGFTLIELMVVLTVIALLLSVVVPDYVGRIVIQDIPVLAKTLTVYTLRVDATTAERDRVGASAMP